MERARPEQGQCDGSGQLQNERVIGAGDRKLKADVAHPSHTPTRARSTVAAEGPERALSQVKKKSVSFPIFESCGLGASIGISASVPARGPLEQHKRAIQTRTLATEHG